MEREEPEWVQVGPYRLSPSQVQRLLEVGGVSTWFLLDEAAYSVALDRDSSVRTVSLDELSPEQQQRYQRSSQIRHAQPETD